MKINQSFFAIPALLLSVIILSGCSSETKKTTVKTNSSESKIYDTKWLIQELSGTRVVVPESSQEIYMIITDAGNTTGSSGCNTFTGKSEISGAKIKIGPLATTRKMCPPEQMETERKFLNAVNSATGYQVTGSTLTLFDVSGVEVAKFNGFKQLGIPGE